MSFTDPKFLLFFAVLWPLFAVMRSRMRTAMLLGASYFFFACTSWESVLTLAMVTAVGYCAALNMEDKSPVARKRILAFAVAFDLALLAVFKYSGFLWNSLLLPAISPLCAGIPAVSISLPSVGVSFFVFQSISCMVDVYRGTVRPPASLLNFAAYAGMFTQILSGPIVRAGILLPQIEANLQARAPDIKEGLLRFCRGFAKKACLADSLAIMVVDPCYASPETQAPERICLAVLAYGLQLYLDFSGYSDMAIGIARTLGFRIPENFDHPYRAASVTEFWRRWHISLSSWIRDYIYIPLGGNRRGAARTLANLMITMTLCGLWHGASILFVLWGAIHGLLLVAERLLRKAAPGRMLAAIPRPLRTVAAFLLITLSWIPFRAGDANTMLRVIRALTHADILNFPAYLAGLPWEELLLLGIALGSHYVSGPFLEAVRFSRWPLPLKAVAVGTVIFWCLHYFPETGRAQPFIYSKF